MSIEALKTETFTGCGVCGEKAHWSDVDWEWHLTCEHARETGPVTLARIVVPVIINTPQDLLADDDCVMRGVAAVRKMLQMRVGDKHAHAEAFRKALKGDEMGAEQYMIVSEESLRDEDGPHEVDVKIVPGYGEIAKDNRAELEKLAQRLSDNFDGRYIVISMTQYWEAK